MVRISKQAERRQRCPHRCRPPAAKTGPVKDNLPEGYKSHVNTVQGAKATSTFIGKVK